MTDIKLISDKELKERFDKIKKQKAFGFEMIALSEETKRRKEKNLADDYRAEFSSLSDGVILNCMMSFSGDNFKTLTQLAEEQSDKFIKSEPF